MQPAIPVVFVAVFLAFHAVSATPRAGLYVDNGRGQSAMEKLMSKAEKREMEMEFLNLLGEALLISAFITPNF